MDGQGVQQNNFLVCIVVLFFTLALQGQIFLYKQCLITQRTIVTCILHQGSSGIS